MNLVPGFLTMCNSGSAVPRGRHEIWQKLYKKRVLGNKFDPNASVNLGEFCNFKQCTVKKSFD